jgi:hypothetical protein
MSGRALFSINPDLFEDAEGADDIDFDEEEKDAGPANQGRDDDDSEEEKQQEVAVDSNLFADEGAAACDEEVDFD